MVMTMIWGNRVAAKSIDLGARLADTCHAAQPRTGTITYMSQLGIILCCQVCVSYCTYTVTNNVIIGRHLHAAVDRRQHFGSGRQSSESTWPPIAMTRHAVTQPT
jgi:hypothetical protein